MGKRIVVGQSGGPTVVINASLAGVLRAAAESGEIEAVYGMRNGVDGLLREDLVLLDPYCTEENYRLLCQTPAMALGSCRHKLSPEELPLVAEIMQKHKIDGFLYIGGNDSMDTVAQLSHYFAQHNLPMQAIGIPKTIDNDLPVTDHSPGYGSAAKYLYCTLREIIADCRIYPVKSVTIVEVMGRSSGWLALAAGLPALLGEGAPQIVALPEVPFREEEFLDQVRHLLERDRNVICAVSEGIKDPMGSYVGQPAQGAKDVFGNPALGGVGKYLEQLVRHSIGCKVRSVELNIAQRCAAHLASGADITGAERLGAGAVELFLQQKTGVAAVLERVSNDPYRTVVTLTAVENLANKRKDVPLAWCHLEDSMVKQQVLQYLLPLIGGETAPTVCDENGLPVYFRLHN